MEEELEEKETINEIYDNDILKEGDDVIDTGYDYGDPQQGIEDEGNGMDDYSTEILENVNEDLQDLQDLQEDL